MESYLSTNKIDYSLDSIKVGCHANLPPRFDTAPLRIALCLEFVMGPTQRPASIQPLPKISFTRKSMMGLTQRTAIS